MLRQPLMVSGVVKCSQRISGAVMEIGREGIASSSLLALAFPGALLFLGLGGHANDGQRLVVAGQKSVQARSQFEGVGPIVVDPAVALVQAGGANHVVADAQDGQLPVQPEARRLGFVATDGTKTPGQRAGCLREAASESTLASCQRLRTANSEPMRSCGTSPRCRKTCARLGWTS